MAQSIGGVMVKRLIEQYESEQRLLAKMRAWEDEQEKKREEPEEYER